MEADVIPHTSHPVNLSASLHTKSPTYFPAAGSSECMLVSSDVCPGVKVGTKLGQKWIAPINLCQLSSCLVFGVSSSCQGPALAVNSKSGQGRPYAGPRQGLAAQQSAAASAADTEWPGLGRSRVRALAASITCVLHVSVAV